MFAGFNLKMNEDAILGDLYYEIGKKLLEKDKAIIEGDLKKYVCENQYLDGSSIQNNWFPQIEADVFISHSHKDEKLIISFAGWLHELFGLKAFIDSTVWGYSNDLLKIIDNKYCVKSTDGDNTTYSYEKRNYSTSHVHMMLSMALTKMMDKAECLFFINTPQSIMVSDTIKMNSTLSPWIYAELQISEIIRHKKLKEYRPEIIEKKAFSEYAQLNIKYDVSLDHLATLNNSDLLEWWKYGRKSVCTNPLDKLYDIKGLLPKALNG